MLEIILLGISAPSKAVSSKISKVLDNCTRYRLKEKTALKAIKDLKLIYEGKDDSESESFIQLYCSVFTPKENVNFN